MIYLDYAANTPADEHVLRSYLETQRNYIANPNSSHPLGKKAKSQLEQARQELADCLHVLPEEIIYTSGASEGNNLAIKGIAGAYRENGKHIISTCLEHPSVSGSLTYLQSIGYEIDLVDILPTGQIDLMHLKELLRKDTVLVSICMVDSELGTIQPIKEVAELLKDYPNCYLHTDATQAVGKIPVDFSLADITTFTPHKFHGLNGIGVMIKKQEVVLLPQIHGGSSTSIYRSGTPDLANVVACTKAVQIAYEHREERNEQVVAIRERVLTELSKLPMVRRNSTDDAIPHILNLSVKGVKATKMKELLEKRDICLSIKSACSTTITPSRPVYAVTKDKKNASSSFRISFSYLTTLEEVDEFLNSLKESISEIESSTK